MGSGDNAVVEAVLGDALIGDGSLPSLFLASVIFVDSHDPCRRRVVPFLSAVDLAALLLLDMTIGAISLRLAIDRRFAQYSAPVHQLFQMGRPEVRGLDAENERDGIHGVGLARPIGPDDRSEEGIAEQEAVVALVGLEVYGRSVALGRGRGIGPLTVEFQTNEFTHTDDRAAVVAQFQGRQSAARLDCRILEMDLFRMHRRRRASRRAR